MILEIKYSDIKPFLLPGAVLVGTYYFTQVLYSKIMIRRAQFRWRNTPKDKVILHQPTKGVQVISLSPFCIKLETYLRMAKIDYEVDTSDAFYGPSLKIPWISLNGEHLTDSQLILSHLGKKFEKSFGGSYTKEQLAGGDAVRVMLEEHFLFGGIFLWRFVSDEGRRMLPQIKKYNLSGKFWTWLLKFYYRKVCYYQGIGRRTSSEIHALMTRDLEIVSELLGNKKFLLGDEPCEIDCSIFGFTAEAMWGLIGSPYQKLVNDRFTNLRDYTLRMKELYFPDWEALLKE